MLLQPLLMVLQLELSVLVPFVSYVSILVLGVDYNYNYVSLAVGTVVDVVGVATRYNTVSVFVVFHKWIEIFDQINCLALVHDYLHVVVQIHYLEQVQHVTEHVMMYDHSLLLQYHSLQQEHVFTADIFMDLYSDFAITKTTHVGVA